MAIFRFFLFIFQTAPKEWRRRRAGKLSFKRVLLESQLSSLPPQGLRFQHLKTLDTENVAVHFCVLDDRSSARRLLHSLSAPPSLDYF